MLYLELTELSCSVQSIDDKCVEQDPFTSWAKWSVPVQIEGKVVEISRLQEIFGEKVLEQVW